MRKLLVDMDTVRTLDHIHRTMPTLGRPRCASGDAGWNAHLERLLVRQSAALVECAVALVLDLEADRRALAVAPPPAV